MTGWVGRLVSGWLLAACAFAQGAPLVVGASDQYSLAPYVQVLEDPGGALQLADVLQPMRQALFSPMRGSGPAANFGLTRSAIWLAIVKNAVETHGGSIAVESRLGAGTAFTVRLRSVSSEQQHANS